MRRLPTLFAAAFLAALTGCSPGGGGYSDALGEDVGLLCDQARGISTMSNNIVKDREVSPQDAYEVRELFVSLMAYIVVNGMEEPFPPAIEARTSGMRVPVETGDPMTDVLNVMQNTTSIFDACNQDYAAATGQ